MQTRAFVVRTSMSTYTARRDMLRHLVRKQIHIATDLMHSEGPYSRDTQCAWDVVEELSRKLNMIEVHLAQDRMDPLQHRDMSMYDAELSVREYDV